MFNVLATSAAGLAEDALQTALLKQLTGLQLPGWEQLLVISLGELTGPMAVQLSYDSCHALVRHLVARHAAASCCITSS